MERLIAEISAKTGLPADQAREVANMVINFIKEKLPAPIAAQVDGVLGSNQVGSVADQALDSLGGLFGKK